MSMRYYISTEEASFFNNNRMGYGTGIPTSGNYKVGDFIISSTQKDGIFGWVCTVSGTPGEWEVIGSGMNNGSGGGNKVVGYVNAVSFSNTRNSVEIGIDEYEKGKDFLEVHYNGLMLAEGVHYNVSSDGRSIEAIDGSWNENADDIQQMIFRVLKSEGIGLKELKNTINIDNACYEVELGIEGYNPDKDVIEVHLNGVLLVQGLDYNVSDGKIIKVDTSEAWNPYNVNGQKMFVKVMRNKAALIEPSDGSVTIDKLSPDVAEDVRAIDGLVNSISLQNNTISNIDNRIGALEEEVDDKIANIDLSNYATKEDLNPYQEKNSDSLATNSKDIVGAINEVFLLGNNVKQYLVDALIAKGLQCSTSDSFITLINLIYSLGNNNGGDSSDNDELISGAWNVLAALSVAKSAVSICTDGAKIYCLGGLNASNTATNLFTCYDTTTNTWETLTPFPINVFGASCVYKDDDNTIRVFSKMDTPNSKASTLVHYKYDIVNNNWTNISFSGGSLATIIPSAVFYDNVSSGRYVMLIYNNTGSYAGVKLYTELTGFDYIYQTSTTAKFLISSANCYHNGRIYSIGGIDDTTLASTTIALDIGSSTIMTLTPIPEPIVGASAEVYDNKIYVFGGLVISNSVTQLNSKIFVYDISNNIWDELDSSMTAPRCNIGSCIIDNKIYAIGGDTGNGNIEISTNPTTDVDVFVIGGGDDSEPEPESGVYYDVATLGTPRKGMAVEAVNGKLYIMGGIKEGGTASNLYHSYDPVGNTWSALTSTRYNHGFLGSVVYLNNYIMTLGGDSTSGTYAYNCAYDIGNNTWGSGDNASLYQSAIQDPYIGFCQSDNKLWSIVRTPTDGAYTFYAPASATTTITFTDGPSFDSPKINYHSACCTNATKMFLIGGQTSNDIATTTTVTKKVYSLDMDNYLYQTELANCPYAITGATAEIFGDNIYVIGGYIKDDSELKLNTKTFVYNINSDSWTTLDISLITPRAYCKSAIIDDVIYIVGGTTSIVKPLSGDGVVGNIEAIRVSEL